MHVRFVLTIACSLVACTPKPADTDDESGSSATATDGAEATSATGTGGVDPTGASTTATSPGDDTGISTGTSATGTTGADPSTDTEGDAILGACLAACVRWDMCEPQSVGPPDNCAVKCASGFQEPAECAAAASVQFHCIAGLACEEALKYLFGEMTSCLRELEAVDVACNDAGCGDEVGGDAETCEFQQTCDGPTQKITCEGETCTCTQDGAPDEQCSSPGFCALSPGAQREAITACCGWSWE